MRGPLEIVSALGLPPVTGVLQVGANIGQENEYFIRNGVNYAIQIEPLDAPFQLLCQRCAGLNGFLPVQALCGSRDGDAVDLYIASNFGQSSSILRPTGHLDDYPSVEFPEKITAHTFTLDRIFAAATAQRPDIAAACNLLFMDVQGAESHVLRGASAVLQKVDYIYTEVGLGGSYENDVLFEDLIAYLKVFDFRLCESEMNPEGWGNAMFIRRTGRRWGRATPAAD